MKVTVTPKPVAVPILTGVVISGPTSVVEGTTAQYTMRPVDQTGKEMDVSGTWESASPSILAINGATGLATALLAGTAEIGIRIAGKLWP